MKEKKRKWKEAGTAERFHLKILLMAKKKMVPLQSVQMAYIMPKTRKITKIHELPYYIEGKMGSKPKSDKRVKKVKSAGKVNNGMKGEQWHEAISQPTKFHRLQKFRNPAFCFFSSFGFCFSFLLVSDL